MKPICLWLNLVCLDAPLVAVSWAWLFARSFGIPVAPGGMVALFLSAWLIYLADRFGDSLSLERVAATSLRQRFCLRHRVAWIVGMIAVALADLFVVVTQIEFRAFVNGAAVGTMAFGYLVLNRVRPAVWRRVPLKETCIGFLFAAGTMVPLAAYMTGAVASSWMFFALLCSLNCMSIAVWERALDQTQGRVSIATEVPKVARFLTPALLVLGAACGALALFGLGSWPVYSCLAGSAFLLATVNVWRGRIAPDTRTALADLVLLTPVALLVFRFAARFAGA